MSDFEVGDRVTVWQYTPPNPEMRGVYRWLRDGCWQKPQPGWNACQCWSPGDREIPVIVIAVAPYACRVAHPEMGSLAREGVEVPGHSLKLAQKGFIKPSQIEEFLRLKPLQKSEVIHPVANEQRNDEKQLHFV